MTGRLSYSKMALLDGANDGEGEHIIFYSDRLQNVPVASDLGSGCIESVQCSTTLGSLVGCVQNVCSCVEDSVEVDGKCSEKKSKLSSDDFQNDSFICKLV